MARMHHAPGRCRRFQPEFGVLEARTLLSSSPFKPEFGPAFAGLLQENYLPQGAVALTPAGASSAATWHDTNSEYYEAYGLPAPAELDSDSVFRIGSTSKTFTSTAIMHLVQEGKIGLEDSAYSLLGYTPGQVISGYDPLTGDAVSATINPGLFDIKVRELLQMTSGLSYNIPLANGSRYTDASNQTREPFRNAKPGDVMYEAGQYASLAFAGPTAYDGTGAQPSQLLHYMTYAVSADSSLLGTPGTKYFYCNANFEMLGMIVAIHGGASGTTPMERYFNYLDANILQPIGITRLNLGGSNPNPGPLRVGLAGTTLAEAYPTEVAYWPQQPPGYSPFPTSAFGSTKLPLIPLELVATPYGGFGAITSHFSAGGLVSTPSALSRLMESLSSALEGSTTEPLAQASVQAMVERPVAPPPGGLPADEPAHGWFGFGLVVTPSAGGVTFSKEGDFSDGTFSYMQRNPDGSTWSVIFNRYPGAGMVGKLQPLVNANIADPPVARPDAVTTGVDAPVGIAVLSNDTDPNVQGALQPWSVTIITPPANGQAVVDAATGVVTYTPRAGFSGADALDYVVSDNYQLTSALATVTIRVEAAIPPGLGRLAEIPVPPGARTAVGDVNGDGIEDLVIGSPAGQQAVVRVYDGRTGELQTSFQPFGARFRRGLGVAAGDLNGDGRAELLVWPGQKGSHPYHVFDGVTGRRIRQPFRRTRA